MEKSTHDKIVERASVKERDIISDIVKKINDHFATGQTEHFFLGSNEKNIEALIEILGLEVFDGSRVLAYAYSSRGPGPTLERSSTEPGFEGEWPFYELLGQIGDIGAGLEFMNDFKVTVVIEIDTETVMLCDYTSSTEPVVCQACVDSGDYGPNGINKEDSCDHCEDNNFSNYDVVISKKLSQDETDRILSFGL
jgi:hypothetical protein